ncbi:MAG TPA: hypothetical protein VJ764_07390 [Steroidobacteraceae bacterium]|nr:hypothetical protein [Steroidobacteraceae bacterium]
MKTINRTALTVLSLAALAALAGCGDVEVAAESQMPTPLIDPLPVTVGIHYSDDFSKYQHAEERWGVKWKAELGPYHVRMAEKLFLAAFRETVPVKDLKALPASPPYVAIIEPRIEQYSFITPKDTGANYYAVTIKYRLNVLAPSGETADSLTFTGYGSFKSGGMSTTTPMVSATKAAMRDAAAKFLVQFPEQDVARKLVAGTPLIEPSAPVVATTPSTPVSGEELVIQTVPILDPAPADGAAAPAADTSTPPTPQSSPGDTPTAPPADAPAPTTQTPAPAETPPEPETQPSTPPSPSPGE